jgi:hypothetical protein
VNAPPTQPPSDQDPGGAGFRALLRDLAAAPRGALLILVTTPIALTLVEYIGLPWHYLRTRDRLSSPARRLMQDSKDGSRTPEIANWFAGLELPFPPIVQGYIWWSLACLLFMVVLPTCVLGLGTRTSPRDLGVRLTAKQREWKPYLILYLVFLPIIYLVSRDPEFLKTYPFWRPPGLEIDGAFLAFQAFYCLQFFAVEFFFRGFLVLGLKPHIGRMSVLVMLAPYCMVHFYKPMPEALGAIGAGLILGFLAWRSGTILYGWLLHYGVALTMDLLALEQLAAQG